MAGPAIVPSGEQIFLRHGRAEATIVEVGGGIRALTSAGRPILDGYPEADRVSAGRGQILVPWPNRLGDGVYDFGGTRHQLALTDVPGRTAMHGLARWLPWRLTQTGVAGATAAVMIAPQPGWPTWLRVTAHYELEPGALTVRLEAANVGHVRCPFGLGMHPYVSTRSALDGAFLRAPGTHWLRTDDRGLPVSWSAVNGDDRDLRAGRRLRGTVLDTCFVVPAGGWEVAVDDTVVWADGAFGYLQLFTGDTDPDPARRRTAIAVEPMTCPPNAFRTGEGLLTLEPGERWTGSWGVRFSTE